MKLTILRNIGTADRKKLGVPDDLELVEGETVDVPDKLGEKLLEAKVAEHPVMKGVPAKSAPPAAAKAVPLDIPESHGKK